MDDDQTEGMVTRQGTESASILLMSEDRDAARAWGLSLACDTWRVRHAGEFIEALSAVRNEHVDVAVLHLPMDDMEATDLPNVLRQVSPSAYLPVIVLGDEPRRSERLDFLHGGADDCICTTTSPEEVIARISALLRVKELHDQLATSRLALQEALRRERHLLTKLRKENSHLQALVTTDPLTHVQNRRSFNDLLDHEFKIAKRYGQPLSLLALDVDHFKVVNDAYGHPTGDYVLKELAVILTQSVRESDVVARTGGEEFCVLLPQAGVRQAAQFAERIRSEVYRREFIVFGETIHVTISIGSATWPADAEITGAGMLFYFADQALLLAKESGRDRVVSVGEMDGQLRRRLRRHYQDVPLTGEEAKACAHTMHAAATR